MVKNGCTLLLLFALLLMQAAIANPTIAAPGQPVDGLSLSSATAAALPLSASRFPDVSEDYWASSTVRQLVYQGAVEGYPDGTFRPDRAITRAEFAAMITAALKVPLDAHPGFLLLDDTSIPGWAYVPIMTAFKDGIIPGYTDGSFRPGNSITRGEIAVMAANTLRVSQMMTRLLQPNCPDAGSIPDWAKGDVAFDLAEGIMTGYPDGTFQASRQVTRAEAAALVLELMKLSTS
jgi:hypothetical protein